MFTFSQVLFFIGNKEVLKANASFEYRYTCFSPGVNLLIYHAAQVRNFLSSKPKGDPLPGA